MNLWITNTSGKRDAVLTFTLIGFVLIVFKVLVAGTTIKLGPFSYTGGPIGADVIAAVLGPTLGAYVGRRWTDRKFSPVDEYGQTSVVPTDQPDDPAEDMREANQ